ncbi:MAG TPA: thioredoxin family protein [Candidatus Polarisedimenticolia bacterium]|nr:thioredoxin family protein [Candidatus Polarisedimenticolia bacterium]
MSDPGPVPPQPPPAGPRRGPERILLSLVLLIAGGVIGYAAYRMGSGPERPDLPPGDVEVVSHGEPVDLAALAVKGKYTVYDFYADWCPPCRSIDVGLRSIASRHPNVAIRKIDIVDWTTPVVEQHRVTSLPHLVLFGPDGEPMASGDAVYPLLSRLFDAELD